MHFIVFIFITLIKIQCNAGVNKVSCEFNMFITAVGFIFLSNYDGPRTKVFTIKKGALGFSVSRIWPIFCSDFWFSHLKNALFWFWCLARFAGFLQVSLWFSVFVNNDGGFSDFSVSNSFYGFCDLAKDVTPSSRAKAVRPRDHFQYSILPFLLEEWMTSLV